MPDKSQEKKTLKNKKHSIFNSAGIWQNRSITQQELREKAWKRA